MTTMINELDAAAEFAVYRNRLWLTATAALTAAARLIHPSGGRIDFAEFVSDALAAAAANVGGIDELLTGCTGSWEANLIDQLVTGLLGHDPTDAELADRRTEPVVVRLNVAGLVDLDSAPGNGPYIDALDELDARYDTATTTRQTDALAVAAGELHRDWADRYTAYADRFTDAVHTAAARLGITVPVTVEANTDPDDPYGEPDNTGQPGWADRPYDLLAWQLWRAGLDAHPITEITHPADQPTPLPVAAALPTHSSAHQARSA